MRRKRVALIGYPADYFLSFSQALEQSGFEIYWVSNLQSNAQYLTDVLTVAPDHVLDTTAGFDAITPHLDDCRANLSKLESVGGPRLYDVILMDRLLRKKPQAFAIRYLRHLQRILTKFFLDNDITLVISGRDTALAMISMLVSRALDIPWVVPTRLRIPQEMYGFCQGHEAANMVRVRPVTEEDRVWAKAFLRHFDDRKSTRPALRKATRTFADVIRLLPVHFRVFWRELANSTSDRGNDYSRYTIPQLILRYVKRRINLLVYTVFPPYASPSDGPFCVYTLHTQPESSIDVAGSYFSNQIALITFIARSLPVTHELYVKVHPTDVDGQPLSFYRQIAKIPGVRLINYDVDSRDLIRRSSIVFSLTGTIAYEAGLMGKMAVTFANNYFNEFPTVYYCDSPPRLPSLIETLLNAKPSSEINQRIVEVLADLKSRTFNGEMNRMYGENPRNLSPEDLNTLQGAYDTLYKVLTLSATTDDLLETSQSPRANAEVSH